MSTATRSWRPWHLLVLPIALLLLVLAWHWQKSSPEERLQVGDEEQAATDSKGSELPGVPAGTGPATATGTTNAFAGADESANLEIEVVPAAPVVVRGRVLNKEDRTPVAFVDVIFASKGGESTATSDERGEYSLSLGKGSYQVRAIGDRVMAIGLPPFLVGLVSREYDISVVEHSAIRGQVFFADKSPAVGAIVAPEVDGKSVAGSSARGELGSAEVQADGSFELFTLQGNLILHATSESAGGSVRVTALKAGEARNDVEITVVPNGYIEGSVIGPKGAALSAVKVLASMQIPGSGEYDRIPISTDAKGHFRYQVLRPGHTIVEASARGFAQSTPLAFTLKPGESRKEIVLVLHEANLSLSGRVVDSEGEPLAYVEIAQGQEGSKERYQKTLSNSEGEFAISGLGPGPHRLRARKSGYEQTRLREIAAPSSELRIEMASSGESAGAGN